MKPPRLVFCSLWLTLLLSVDALANEAQSDIFRAGVLIGQAEARLHFFGLAFRGNLPQDQIVAIRLNLTEAANRITAAEGLFQVPFSSLRGTTMQRIVRRLNDFERATAQWNYRQKPYYLADLERDYRNGLQYTFNTARQDAIQWKGTCDSAILDAGYHLGKAITAANISAGDPAMRRRLFADTYQQKAFSEMRNTIGFGLRIAIDGDPPGAPRGLVGSNVEKTCCSFGSSVNWRSFLSSLRWNSSALAFDAAGFSQMKVIARTDLRPGACGGRTFTPPPLRNPPGQWPNPPNNNPINIGEDRLGHEWSITEAVTFTGRWVRRGNSKIWDATWNNGAVAELSITIVGDKVRISRRDVGGTSIGLTAIYEGTLAPDGTMQGTETVTWPGHFTNKTQNWQGRIVRR